MITKIDNRIRRQKNVTTFWHVRYPKISNTWNWKASQFLLNYPLTFLPNLPQSALIWDLPQMSQRTLQKRKFCTNTFRYCREIHSQFATPSICKSPRQICSSILFCWQYAMLQAICTITVFQSTQGPRIPKQDSQNQKHPICQDKYNVFQHLQARTAFNRKVQLQDTAFFSILKHSPKNN